MGQKNQDDESNLGFKSQLVKQRGWQRAWGYCKNIMGGVGGFSGAEGDLLRLRNESPSRRL